MKLSKTPHTNENLQFYLNLKYNIRMKFLQNNGHCLYKLGVRRPVLNSDS